MCVHPSTSLIKKNTRNDGMKFVCNKRLYNTTIIFLLGSKVT